MLRLLFKDGTWVIGITKENVAKLVSDEPLMIDFTEFGVPAAQIFVMYGDTKLDLIDKLLEANMINQHTYDEMKAEISKEGDEVPTA
jgi:hypothetical protein